MTEIKTKKNDKSVDEFLKKVEDPKKREDAITLVKLLEDVTQAKPAMWGDSIIGFGDYHYKYKSGREGNWFLAAMSPRKQAHSVYLTYGFAENKELMNKLGKCKTGKGCLYIKKVEDVDLNVLKELIKWSIKKLKELYPEE